MKRALKKKEKAELENNQSDDVPVEQVNAIHPRLNNHRVPTKAAMIGLAISMGATSLLVTRQSDRAIAAEPVGNQNTASTIPAASDTKVKLAPTTQPQVQAVSSVSLPESPAVVEPTAISQVAELRAKWQGSSKVTPLQPVSLPVVVSNSSQAVEDRSVSLETTTVQQQTIKQEETVQTLSNASGFVGTQAMSAPAQQEAVQTEDPVEPEVNAQLKAQQEFALNQLQQKSDRLRKSLKELRSNQAQEALPVMPAGVPQVTVLEKKPQIESRNTVTEPSETASNVEREKLLSRLRQRLETTKVPTQVPTAAGVNPSVQASATYEVKPGDTLAEIAGNYNTSVSELVKVNNLNNPNQLRINQKLTVPVTENRSTSSSVAIARPRSANATPQSPVVFGNTASTSQESASNSIANSSSVTTPTPAVPNNSTWKNRLAGTTADKSIENNASVPVNTPIVADDSVRKNQVAQGNTNSLVPNNSNVTVPTAVIADSSIKTESTTERSATSATNSETNSSAASSFGVGGDSPVPTVFAEMREAQKSHSSAARKVKDSQRLRSLQAEINKLREKYRAQQSGSVVVPAVSETDSTPVTVSQSNENESAVQIQVPTPNSSSLQFSSPRVNGAISIPVPKPMTGNGNRQPVKPIVGNRRPANEPVNPELLRAPRVATPSRGMNASEVLGTMQGTTVTPQLPPLAAVDRYLPRPIDETLAPPSTSTTGYMWPAKGVLTSGYGPRWGRMHRGIDIANATGTPIHAVAEGVVERAGWNNGGYGYLVDIRHSDGTLTRYGHNSRIMVQPGQPIQQGQQISAMGSTGFSTGPHLHFEVHPSGKGAVNPIAFLPKERL
ncbi:peptidase M23 [Scytonema hofmannii PCC 7110]|uniref:Peptidase M23 n=1 Tax=Scytonema hofmannii PCC 7110 TaxID=128403 RepID=A0A139X9V3_9CYAN|nr:peptidoglycan DD-metalloendopeptidase family protein [Scytonema hofmannii]KYC41412.1 peptidase M23 [Scytonema hofmannii PCC 7110]